MSRLATTFARLRMKNERALVAYLCAGDPDLETSEALLVAAARAGADILEVGVPFSDPTADGPVLVRAAGRALAAGASVAKVLGLVSRLTKTADVPVVLFGYWNPFLRYGPPRLASELAAAGGDAVLVVDLPPEEAGELAHACRAHALDLVSLLAPTSTDERIAAATAVGSGFVYYVSVTGVTGAKIAHATEVARAVADMRAKVPSPVVVGFGIRTPEEARALGAAADGVVVGTALVEKVEKAGSRDEAVRSVSEAVAGLKAALR
jgi:tryptophan synthase alpha chain